MDPILALFIVRVKLLSTVPSDGHRSDGILHGVGLADTRALATRPLRGPLRTRVTVLPVPSPGCVACELSSLSFSRVAPGLSKSASSSLPFSESLPCLSPLPRCCVLALSCFLETLLQYSTENVFRILPLEPYGFVFIFNDVEKHF